MTYLTALALIALGALITTVAMHVAYRAGQAAGTDRSVGALRLLQTQLERGGDPDAAVVATTADLLEDA